MRLLLIFGIAAMSGLATHDYIHGYYGFATFELVMAFGLLYEFTIREAK